MMTKKINPGMCSLPLSSMRERTVYRYDIDDLLKIVPDKQIIYILKSSPRKFINSTNLSLNQKKIVIDSILFSSIEKLLDLNGKTFREKWRKLPFEQCLKYFDRFYHEVSNKKRQLFIQEFPGLSFSQSLMSILQKYRLAPRIIEEISSLFPQFGESVDSIETVIISMTNMSNNTLKNNHRRKELCCLLVVEYLQEQLKEQLFMVDIRNLLSENVYWNEDVTGDPLEFIHIPIYMNDQKDRYYSLSIPRQYCIPSFLIDRLSFISQWDILLNRLEWLILDIPKITHHNMIAEHGSKHLFNKISNIIDNMLSQSTGRIVDYHRISDMISLHTETHNDRKIHNLLRDDILVILSNMAVNRMKCKKVSHDEIEKIRYYFQQDPQYSLMSLGQSVTLSRSGVLKVSLRKFQSFLSLRLATRPDLREIFIEK